MRTTIHALIVVCCAASVFAQEQQKPDARETMGRLSRSAEQELARSVQDLNRLREQIAAEKLPLAQELTSLEQKVTNLRKEHDRVTRLVDAGNLEIPAIKAEMKARTDELSYIANLLDEYARSFESKVNVSELQYIGQAILTAKQATEDATLSTMEKFSRQTAFVTVSIKRLFDAVGGMRFPGVGVDDEGTVAEGDFALLGPVALFRAKSGKAGVVVPQTGSDKPLIRPLEGEIQAGLTRLVADGEGTMPLDPSRGGALKALVQKTNLIHIFEKGGPIMWPLLLASVLALGTVLERVFFLLNVKRNRDPKRLGRLLGELEKGDAESAVEVGRGSKDFVVRALTYALGHKEQSLSHALLYAQSQEVKRFRRGIPILDTVITLAPLLGLLGTVTGMMGSFSIIGGELSAPGAITGGIAEALIATAFGLGIAITALIPFNILNARTEDAKHDLDSAATQVELLVQPQQKSVVWAPQRPITAFKNA
jgi:biopolymer transport protein ExbB